MNSDISKTLNSMSHEAIASFFTQRDKSAVKTSTYEQHILKRTDSQSRGRQVTTKAERIFKSFCRKYDGPKTDLQAIHRDFLLKTFGFNLD